MQILTPTWWDKFLFWGLKICTGILLLLSPVEIVHLHLFHIYGPLCYGCFWALLILKAQKCNISSLWGEFQKVGPLFLFFFRLENFSQFWIICRHESLCHLVPFALDRLRISKSLVFENEFVWLAENVVMTPQTLISIHLLILVIVVHRKLVKLPDDLPLFSINYGLVRRFLVG